MPSRSHGCRQHARRAGAFNILSGGCVLGLSLIGFTLAASFSPEAHAQQSRTMLQVGRFPAGQAELGADDAALKQIALTAAQAPSSGQPITRLAAQAPSFPAVGNLKQVMRGILFPSSNLIFDVQVRDPGAQTAPSAAASAADATLTVRFAGIYAGWELVDYAAVALAESAPLMLTPGRRCENGKPVPVERDDWVKYTQELAEAGKAAYKASQSRNRDAVSDASNQVADACLNCHTAYRDKPGGNAAHCVP